MPNDAIHIPEGHYLTKAQIAKARGVIQQTVQQWIDKGWLPSIQIPGLGHIVNLRDLENFTPLKPGPRAPHQKK